MCARVCPHSRVAVVQGGASVCARVPTQRAGAAQGGAVVSACAHPIVQVCKAVLVCVPAGGAEELAGGCRAAAGICTTGSRGRCLCPGISTHQVPPGLEEPGSLRAGPAVQVCGCRLRGTGPAPQEGKKGRREGRCFDRLDRLLLHLGAGFGG